MLKSLLAAVPAVFENVKSRLKSPHKICVSLRSRLYKYSLKNVKKFLTEVPDGGLYTTVIKNFLYY